MAIPCSRRSSLGHVLELRPLRELAVDDQIKTQVASAAGGVVVHVVHPLIVPPDAQLGIEQQRLAETVQQHVIDRECNEPEQAAPGSDGDGEQNRNQNQRPPDQRIAIDDVDQRGRLRIGGGTARRRGGVIADVSAGLRWLLPGAARRGELVSRVDAVVDVRRAMAESPIAEAEPQRLSEPLQVLLEHVRQLHGQERLDDAL